MRIFYFIIIFLLFSSIMYAQETGGLRIFVRAAGDKPLPFAVVELFRKSDNFLVKYQYADPAGKVEFSELLPNDYYCRVSSGGYAPFTTGVVSVAASTIAQLPPVTLTTSSLSNITVTAKVPFIQILPGKTIVNPEASIGNAGATVMEALEKMPGISVDKDGNISLKGKSGVLVLLDGRQTYLDASQLATLLNGMSSSQISQVEIMDQPSSRYDATGNAGIINIKTKKSLQKGFNGSFTTSYSQGFYPKNNNSIQLNYKTGKWNFFANYSAGFNTGFVRIYALRTYFKRDGSVASLLEQPTFMKVISSSHHLKTGFDYSLSSKTTIGINLSGFALERSGTSNNSAEWQNAQGRPDSLIKTNNTSNSNWKNGLANLNFKHTFSSSREVTADVDILGYKIRGDQYFENKLLYPGTYTEATRALIPTDIQIFSAKADYTQHIAKAKIETGFKTSRITTDNLSDYEIKSGNAWLPDYGKSNHFIYTENIAALYGNAEIKQKKWMFQGGLRFEATSYDANQLGNAVQKDSSFSRSYNSLFPTAFISYAADSNHTFSLNAGRRIDRPPFQKLNPFVLIINKYTYQRGNPYYRPQYTWNVQLNHLYKNSLNTSIGYSITTDYFSQVFPLDSNGIVIYTEGNLGRLQHFTFSTGGTWHPASWWTITPQAILVHKKMEGVVVTKLKATITQLTFTMNNQFRAKNGWSGEISGQYVSASQNDIQELVDPAGQLTVGISKAMMKNKATLRLAVRDIFYTQWMKGNTFFPMATEYFKLTRDTRVASISFTYRFGKAFKTNKRSEGSAGEEIQRVGNG